MDCFNYLMTSRPVSFPLFRAHHLASRSLAVALLGSALCLSSAVAADEQAVVSGPAATVSAEDVRAGVALWVPTQNQAVFMANPRAIEDLARGVYMERAVAARAEAQGLAGDPAIAQRLRLARDRVLATAWVERQVGAEPVDEQAVEKLARSIYAGEAERFRLPERVHARHILVAAPLDDSAARAEARAKAQALLADLRGGADFAKLAAEKSDDGSSARKGGDLGLFDAAHMVRPFSNAAFALQQPGDLSEVVETQFGFHIIRLEGREPAGMRPYEEVAEDLRKTARERVESSAVRRVWDEFRQGVTANREAVLQLAVPAEVNLN